jgi:histidinol phosphatase-like PHP family hydrolase
MMKFLESGARCGLIDILAHPCLPLGFMEVYDEVIASVPDNHFLDAFSLAAANNIGIEINAGFLPRSGRNFSLETPTRVLSLAKQAGCKFTFGSDSHSLENLHWVLYLEVFVESLGLTQDDILPLAVPISP